MELKINLAAASLKDAEHAIFLIGAYFGMTNLPTAASNPGLNAIFVNGPQPDFGLDAAQVFAPVPNVAATAVVPVGTPAAPTPAHGASVELDGEGLPWDPRINALGDGGSHPKNSDGKWRAKRGLNDGTLVAKVKAELRQILAAPIPSTPYPPAPAPTVVTTAPAVPPVPPTAPPVAPSVPAPPVAPSAPVVPTTFEQLMPLVTRAVMAGLMPSSAAPQAAIAYGLPTLPALAQRPDLVEAVWTYLKSQYPAIQ